MDNYFQFDLFGQMLALAIVKETLAFAHDRLVPRGTISHRSSIVAIMGFDPRANREIFWSDNSTIRSNKLKSLVFFFTCY